MTKATYHSSGNVISIVANKAYKTGNVFIQTTLRGDGVLIGVCENSAAVGEKVTVRLDGAFEFRDYPGGANVFSIGDLAYIDASGEIYPSIGSAAYILGLVIDTPDDDVIVVRLSPAKI